MDITTHGGDRGSGTIGDVTGCNNSGGVGGGIGGDGRSTIGGMPGGMHAGDVRR